MLPAEGSRTPAISVIVPVYQSAWSIERTIASVLRQRFEGFEVIIVDDGSTDDLHRRIADLVAADPRLRVVRQSNLGLAAARNRGLREARGALVAPIDADDLWHPDFLGACQAALEAEPTAPFAFAYSFRIDEDDYLLSSALTTPSPRHDLPGLLSYNAVGNGSAAMFRRAAMLAAGGYDEELRERGLQGAEDYRLILRLARVAPPVLVERPLVAYRHVSSGMSLGDPDRQLRACLAVIDEFQAEAPELPDSLFRDGRTTMIGWLLPYFVARKQYRRALGLAVQGYVMNPLWFLNPSLRRLHVSRLLAKTGEALRRLFHRQVPRTHLAQAHFAGEQPFHFIRPCTAIVPASCG